ncbi:arf-GAP with dual PH domain-containing protein 1-like [Watersipora subatra]|uniref:arf-GAP with dual PH domain-containing protein 1-like n=1 Tax=Watersipora subatra TaxID=2589382 RepID=UPI00355BF95B
MTTMSDFNRKRLADIKRKPGNDNKCADCGAGDPDWASYSLGVFLCFACCGVHRSLGTHISRTKSLTVDNWEDEQVVTMDDLGNEAAAQKYLVHFPISYRKPEKDTSSTLREQYIRAKYERLEFQSVDRQTYLRDEKTGYLMKKGRDDPNFRQRKFVLLGKTNSLMYFNKENAKKPKAELSLDDLNCCFVPSKIGNLNGLQISYIDGDGATRNIFVYSDDGKEMVDWYMSVRHIKFTRLRIGLPHAPVEDLLSRLTNDFLLEGWLYKTGPDVKHAWKRRWFTLDQRKLLYFLDPLSAYAKGEIYLGHKSDGYSVCEGVPPGRQDYGISFTLTVPGRQFPFSAETREERSEWITVLNNVISTPLTPQDASRIRRNR